MISNDKNGSIIDNKYRLENKIGSGGMGIVYAATCLSTNREVAIKLLNTERGHFSKRAAKRLHREARLVRNLEHPNICSVIDDGFTHEGTPYMVMPLLEGCSLSDMIARAGRISVERSVNLSVQVLSALEAAHTQKIIHRDLKPENIFVISEEGKNDVVKLLDFGISKVIESGDTDTLTRTGDVMGSVHYLAPEQAQGQKEVDYRVDTYAMGVILYQMLTGHRPFDGINKFSIVNKIIYDSFPSPREINANIPLSIESLIVTAMSRDPLKRYESATAMRDALIKAHSEAGEIWGTGNTFLEAQGLTETDKDGVKIIKPRRKISRSLTPIYILIAAAIAFASLYLTIGRRKGNMDDSKNTSSFMVRYQKTSVSGKEVKEVDERDEIQNTINKEKEVKKDETFYGANKSLSLVKYKNDKSAEAEVIINNRPKKKIGSNNTEPRDNEGAPILDKPKRKRKACNNKIGECLPLSPSYGVN
jgi:serine/threonine protein kinase